MVNLEIKDLTKVYNKKTVLDNISFEVKDGEFLSISRTFRLRKDNFIKNINRNRKSNFR